MGPSLMGLKGLTIPILPTSQGYMAWATNQSGKTLNRRGKLPEVLPGVTISVTIHLQTPRAPCHGMQPIWRTYPLVLS